MSLSHRFGWWVSAAVVALLAAVLVPAGPAQAIREASIYQLRPGVVTDPAAPAPTRSMQVRFATGEPITAASWQLLDPGAAVVLEKAIGTATTFTLNPTAENGGVPLPDGDYTLRIRLTDASGSYFSDPRPVKLAFAPAAAPVPSSSSTPTDVVPSERTALRTGASSRVTMVPGVGFGASVPGGVFVVRNAAGAVVRTTTLAPACIGDGIFCIPEEHLYNGGVYEWFWDGKVAGKYQPAGRYTLTAQLPDGFGRVKSYAVGPFWIRHLANLRTQIVQPAAQQARPYRTVIGRCSSVTRPGPHGWASSLGLMSLSRCASTAGTADRAFQSLAIEMRAPLMDRVLSWRLDGYGKPVRAGMAGNLVMMVSSNVHTGPVWRRTAVLGAGLGWHNGTFREIDPDLGSVLTTWAQARVSGGNQYDLKYVRTVFNYRGWVR